MISVLQQRSLELGERPALRQKVALAWRTHSWRDYALQVERAGRGLLALGLGPGEPVGLLGFNRVEWVVGYLGAMAVRGVPVGIYTTSSAEQVEYILAHSQCPILVVEGAAQLELALALWPRLPSLRQVVTMEPLAHPGEDRVLSFAELLARGDAHPRSEYLERVEAIAASDLATLIYTSGTTGPPKAVMLSHQNLYWTAQTAMRVLGEIAPGARTLSYLPLSHIAEQQFTIHLGLMFGLEVWFAESLEPQTLRRNLLEVRPSAFFAVPRIWEKFKSGVEAQVALALPHRRAIFARAREVGLAYQMALLEGRPPGLALRLAHALFERLVYRKVRRALGLDQAELFGSAAAPLGREVLDFWVSMGVLIRELYGQSEDCGATTANSPGATRLGTVGKPLPGVVVRLAPDGEICVRGPNVFAGYYRDPGATALALDPEGFLHSGDVGEMDEQGYLRITDRKKELIITSGGKKAAPQNLEARLKAHPPLSHALVVGEGRSYLAALLTLDPALAPQWAARRGLPQDLPRLAAHPRLREEVQAHVDRINAGLARWEKIKRFEILPEDFTVEAGELTPTLKLKRRVISSRHREEIARLYPEEG